MGCEFGHVIYKYHCAKCSKYFKMELDFDDRLKEWGCPICLTRLKFCGGTDARQSSIGNVGYLSYEKQTEVNWKNLDNDSKEKMLAESYSVNRQKNNEEANKGRFWRHYLPDPNKPLDLSKIKDTEKFVMTGETS